MAGKIKLVPSEKEGEQEQAEKCLLIGVNRCFDAGLPLHEVVAIVWQRMIQRALRKTYGNQTASARLLKISRTTLQWYLRKEKQSGKA